MDFEGEYTIRTASNQQTYEPNTVYPDAVLNIARESASVFQLKRKWEKTPPMLNLTPDFQRGLVWKTKQKSELIESILMGIPLPLIYVKEDEKGVYLIVDGKQRLSTLFSFINNEFALDKLTILKDKNGSRFADLTPLEQNKIEDCSLTLHVIKAPTSDRVTFDLFDRVNRGGTRLNNQEMRNALYQGNATKLINRLAKKEAFVEATEGSIPDDHMKDRYLVLRFTAFYLWQQHITMAESTIVSVFSRFIIMRAMCGAMSPIKEISPVMLTIEATSRVERVSTVSLTRYSRTPSVRHSSSFKERSPT